MYLPCRLGEFAMEFLERVAEGLVPRQALSNLLREAFQERSFSLAQLGSQKGIPILEVGNLNGHVAVETLHQLAPDLGVVLGTRVLKRSTFSIPRLGCINLHKGKVPEYRGMPPGFWELYHQESAAGVTVHFVDDGLDTGDIVGEGTVLIHGNDTPVTLRRKLDLNGNELLVQCIADLAAGKASGTPQPKTGHTARAAPTRRQRMELDRRLGISEGRQGSLVHGLKTLFYLVLLYSGVFYLVRWIRTTLMGDRACVLLYHRINDLTDDVLTTSVQRFAEHVLILRKFYTVVPSSTIVEALQSGEKLAGYSVAIHFDDCYRDVCTEASRLLAHLCLPACSFVSSGFVGTIRAFQHDADKYSFQLDNLTADDLRLLRKRGFEIGSHTVNHVDMGQCEQEEAYRELATSKQDLEIILGSPVHLFSYPFGRKTNVRPETPNLARQAGYKAMFSAYGGFVASDSNLFDLRRVGISERHRPLDLLMEIEGLSLSSLKMRLTSFFSFRKSPSAALPS